MEVSNLTVTAKLSKPVDISKIVGGTPFNKSKGVQRWSTGVKVKLNGVFFAVFASGSINCLRAKSLPQAKDALQALKVKLRQDLRLPKLKIRHIRLRNVAAHYNLKPAPLNLVLLCEYWKYFGIAGQVYYEPERYPALVVHMAKGTVIAYHSGKVLLTKVKDVNDLEFLKDEFNDSVDLFLGPHTVFMAEPRITKRQPRKKKMSELLQNLVEDSPTLIQIDPVSVNMCVDCVKNMSQKKRFWRKRKGKHLVSIEICHHCFKANRTLFRDGKDMPQVPTN
jgi:TATA-box binding protein (TBP) (component of TFIID and TFIIIB)